MTSSRCSRLLPCEGGAKRRRLPGAEQEAPIPRGTGGIESPRGRLTSSPLTDNAQ
jgi:hypothetical protein